MKKAVIALSVLVVALAAALIFTVFGSEEITVAVEDLDAAELKIDTYVESSHIITVATARNLIGTLDDVVVVDIRKAADFALGHIPGSQNIFRGDYSADSSVYGFGGMRTDRAGLETLLGEMGVTDETMILAYDAKGDYDAARFWWQLDMQGFRNVKLIDGGINAWEAAGYEVATGASSAVVEATDFRFMNEENLQRVATVADVIAAQDDPNVVLLDTRSIGEFTGEDMKSGAVRAGRIPGSVWLEYKASLGENTTFLDVETLRARFAEIGVTPDKTIIAYCQSGVRSAHTTFVLASLLGFNDVRNYDGSWIEWSHNEQLALETGMPADVEMRLAGN
ncbi:MAG: sulfurtransferase [Spirochaetales bacterium]|nr:sulfurtransferase [Spirochaetales bacterium]